MLSERTGQLVGYCSHFKLSGFAMVEHRHAGSWLAKLCFPLEVRRVFLDVHCPVAPSGASPPPVTIPLRGERGGVALWMAEGDFHSLSLKQLMVAQLGARNLARGVLSWQSRVSAPGRCHLGAQQPFPSGSDKSAPRQ